MVPAMEEEKWSVSKSQVVTDRTTGAHTALGTPQSTRNKY